MPKYYLDLFAGIGGFALGAYWAGMRFDEHYFSEVDPYAISVYQKRFPDAICLGDIKGIGGGSKLPRGDWFFSGGFPCQDISVAGKGAGLEGSRSGLWFEYARLISSLRPRYAVIENVGALTVRGLDQVLCSLADVGYDAIWQNIRACDLGAPHRRERIWIVAYPNAARQLQQEGSKQEFGRRAGNSGEDVADTHKERRQRRVEYPDDTRNVQGAIEERCQNVSESNSPGCNTVSNAGHDGFVKWKRELQRDKQIIRGREDNGRREKIDAIRKWWSAEPTIHSVVDGLSADVDRYQGRICVKSFQRANQLKCLGNAIVPQIAMMIWQGIKECEENENNI